MGAKFNQESESFRMIVAEVAEKISQSHKFPEYQEEMKKQIAEIIDSGSYPTDYPSHLDVEFWGMAGDTSELLYLLSLDGVTVVAAAGAFSNEELLILLANTVTEAKMILSENFEYQTRAKLGQKQVFSFKRK